MKLLFDFTKAEILDQWVAPKPWMSKAKFMDFKVGSDWDYTVGEFIAKMVFAFKTAVEQIKRQRIKQPKK
jgi:uncharacterized protein YndB with AHSA1/START domain